VGHRNTYWIGTVDQISWVVAAAVAGRIIAAAAVSADKEVVSVAGRAELCIAVGSADKEPFAVESADKEPFVVAEKTLAVAADREIAEDLARSMYLDLASALTQDTGQTAWDPVSFEKLKARTISHSTWWIPRLGRERMAAGLQTAGKTPDSSWDPLHHRSAPFHLG